MNYTEFKTNCIESLSDRFGAYLTLKEVSVTKNNGIVLDGVSISKENESIAATFYFNSFYDELENGKSFKEVMNKLFAVVESNINCMPQISTDFFDSFDNIKNNIYYKLVNYSRNKALLKEIPYRKFLDLAIVFCCRVELGNDDHAAALIRNEHIKMWNVTEEELYETAKLNTPGIFPSKIIPMSEMFAEAMQMEFANVEFDNDFLILTNDKGINGAGTILYDEVLDRVAVENDSNLIIVPSSVHEVILLLNKDFDNELELERMVKEVNDEVVPASDILSYSIYYYDRYTRQINILQ